MAKYSEQDRRTVIGWFPNLQHDANFEITSDCTPAYNCIAWALGMNDVWVGLDHPSNYSWAWWPKEVPCDERTESLIALFEHFGFEVTEHFGFEVTNDPNPEDEYDKVALYADEKGWTHAARVIADNVHHSKIGTAWDIHHSAGNVFSDSEYGSIYAYMKRAISDRYLTDTRKPKVGAITVSDY